MGETVPSGFLSSLTFLFTSARPETVSSQCWVGDIREGGAAAHQISGSMETGSWRILRPWHADPGDKRWRKQHNAGLHCPCPLIFPEGKLQSKTNQNKIKIIKIKLSLQRFQPAVAPLPQAHPSLNCGREKVNKTRGSRAAEGSEWLH